MLVVGSLGLDSLQTPFGAATEVLGGTISYFSLAAALFTAVRVVAVVGEDFPEQHLELFRSKGIDLAGLQRRTGPSFRWSGRYDYDLNVAETLDTRLGVFADFRPELPASYMDESLVFCANIDPDLQAGVLRQSRSRLRALDSMNFWISGKRAALESVVRQVDLVLLNDAEVRQYTQEPNLWVAAQRLLAQGPRVLVIKKGEHGAALVYGEKVFFTPPYPLQTVVDPTGAGDSFAGAFLGYLAYRDVIDLDDHEALKQAMVFGSVVASFTVQELGVDRLARLTQGEVLERYAAFRDLTAFEPVGLEAFGY